MIAIAVAACALVSPLRVGTAQHTRPARARARVGLGVEFAAPPTAENPRGVPILSGTPAVQGAVVVGGGPAGLATAIMLARRGWTDITVLDRLEAPAPPDDAEAWDDAARHYLVGLNGRGQRALGSFGAWPTVEEFCSTVVGRKDWAPGAADGVERIFVGRADTRVIARSRLVACLLKHCAVVYGGAITVRHGVDVSGIAWGEAADGAESATLSCSSCVAAGDDELCTTEGYGAFELSAPLVIGADGARRTIADAMEADGKARFPMALPGSRFRVTKYEDTSVRVYKTVPLAFPPDWRRDINYSCRTRSVNFDALPTVEGEYCGVILIKPDDAVAQGLADVPAARAYFDQVLPQFSASIPDGALAQLIEKAPSQLPVFRYVGPHLHRGGSTVLLGDAIHSIKPYFGLGVNSAFEDVEVLNQALDDAPNLPLALELFSSRRAPEARALVQLSRSFDRGGLFGFVTFILPLILDGIFHGALPQLFAPNTLAMLQRPDVSFQGIRWRKRADRTAQLALLAAGATLAANLAARAAGLAARRVLPALAARGAGGRWPLLAALPLAALGVRLLQLQLGGDVADVLAKQTEGQAGQGAERGGAAEA